MKRLLAIQDFVQAQACLIWHNQLIHSLRKLFVKYRYLDYLLVFCISALYRLMTEGITNSGANS